MNVFDNLEERISACKYNQNALKSLRTFIAKTEFLIIDMDDHGITDDSEQFSIKKCR